MNRDELKSRWLAELTWPDIKAYLATGPRRIILGLGATENHGPHAPLCTDTLIATAVAERLASQLDALAAPVLPIGHSPQHLSFPGTISWPNRLVADALVASTRSLAWHGFDKFIYYSGHGGNKVAIELAISEVLDLLPEVKCVHANQLAIQTSSQFRDAIANVTGQPLEGLWGAHGGEQETSAVLAVRPELVRPERYEPPADVSLYLSRNRDPAVTMADRDLGAHAPNGNWGHPSRANEEQGRAFLDGIAAELAERIIAVLEHAGR